MNEHDDVVLNSSGKVYLYGESGTGKTTLACQRLNDLLIQRSSHTDGILVLIPQRRLAKPYQRVLFEYKNYRDSEVSILTMSGLVRRIVNLFWPLISHYSGFYRPYEPPSFLTLETSQYYMGRIVDPMIAKGYFSTVSLPRNRLLGQLVDNINKSAIVGFPYTEIGQRLSEAWVGNDSQKRVYEDAQTAVNSFRAFCLQNNLLDYSLQVELFKEQLWTNPLCRGYLTRQYRHLIYDNVEEDPPYVHDIIADWWHELKSALIVQDDFAGFNSFLGADPQSASRFKKLADFVITKGIYDSSSPQKLLLTESLIDINKPVESGLEDIRAFIQQPEHRIRFYPELLKKVAKSISERVEEGVSPNEITVITPYLSDSTVFALRHELSLYNISLRVLRPSSSLSGDPVIQSLLFFAVLCHPEWEFPIDAYRISTMIAYALPEFDLVRSHLLSKLASAKLPVRLPLLDEMPHETTERLSESQKALWQRLTIWIHSNSGIYPLDVFFGKLFGELLSQSGFGFHGILESGRKTAQLITSFKKFRASFGFQMDIDQIEIAKEFIKSVQSGLLAATFVSEDEEDKNAILITPVMSFLGLNRAVDYQYWLNPGSAGWYERLEQPLTHPVVLSRNWKTGEKWTADDDIALSKETLIKTVRGLFNRCRKGIYLASSDYSESGQEEKGLLLLHFQALYRRALRRDNEA